MAVSSPALGDALAEIVGREHGESDRAALDRYAVDAVAPRWVARPGTTDEVSRLLTLATAERLAVAPRGSGSNLALGNVPRRLDLVIDTGRLDALTEYVPDDMVVSVQAGFRLAALSNQLAVRGQMLALDPPRRALRSVGGVLASHASGPLRFRYGTARDLLLGVRFVQADGTVTWGGAKVVKSVTGYDVPKLMVGSLGTLGMIVEATLRLHPIPPASGSWVIGQRSAESAERFVAAVLDSSLEPDRLTILNGKAGRLCGQASRELAVLVSVGSVKEAVEAQGAALAQLARSHDSAAETIAPSVWDSLEAALQGRVILRLSCEPRRLLFWLVELERRSTRAGLGASIVGQAGNGVLQAALRGDVSRGVLGNDLLDPLREELRAEGGSVVVESAPPELKAGLDVWGPVSSESFAIMKRVKQEFDPNGILNPGRFVGGL
jgi:glycolate oxidase FAD binding subunit